MNPEKQRIKIAEACGWVRATEYDYLELYPPSNNGRYIYRLGEELRCSDQLPDYPNDLNAMHEASRFLDHEQDHPIIFWETLEKIVGCSDYHDGNETIKVINATAAQRAEAFLRTLGLWEEDEV